MTPMNGALAVGTANYRQMWGNDPTFYQSLKVTIYYVLLAVPVSQVLALGCSLRLRLDHINGRHCSDLDPRPIVADELIGQRY